jgi:hypothetical protein
MLGPMSDPTLNSPAVLIALAAIGLGIVALLLPRQLKRAKQYGARPNALMVVGAAVLLIGLSFQPEIVGVENGLILTIVGVVIAFRPEAVIGLTGGPRPEWLALAEGIALQRMVATHHDRQAAQHDEAVREGLARLATAASPATDRYIELLQATLFQDPEGSGMADRFAALAVEEANLRKVIGPRPAFEGGLVDVEEVGSAVGTADDGATGANADGATPAGDDATADDVKATAPDEADARADDAASD